MSGQKSSCSDNPDIVVGQDGPRNDPAAPKRSPSTLAIQNNNYFAQQIDLEALGRLSEENPKLAEKYMDLVEQQFQHAEEVDERILKLEEREQAERHKDIPYQRRYAFRGQMISAFVVGMSIIAACVLGYFRLEKAAMAVIIVPIGVIAANFLGIKHKTQK